MKSVIFVCLGNICRSPMAELIFKKMLADMDLLSEFTVTSRATSGYETGNGIYPPARKVLREHGIAGEHISTRLTLSDIKNADYVIVMDSANLIDVLRLAGGSYSDKVYKLLSFTDHARDVADPWYTGDFETTYRDIVRGLNGFLKFLNLDK